MTDELKKRMAKLRAIAPLLNSETDQASKLARMVERFLVDELQIGISAECEFDRYETGTDGQNNPTCVVRSLAFGRTSGTFRIHVAVETGVLDHEGEWSHTIDKALIPWPSCDRESKLRAFEKLPALLDQIIGEAERLTRVADLTVAKVQKMTSEEGDFASEFAGSRQYTVADAARATPSISSRRRHLRSQDRPLVDRRVDGRGRRLFRLSQGCRSS